MLEPKYKIINGTSYDSKTSDELVKLLEQLRENKKRVRIFYVDSEKEKLYGMPALRGTIGRSTGFNKVPLLVRSVRAFGGEQLYDANIVEIHESPSGRVLYKKEKS